MSESKKMNSEELNQVAGGKIVDGGKNVETTCWVCGKKTKVYINSSIDIADGRIPEPICRECGVKRLEKLRELKDDALKKVSAGTLANNKQLERLRQLDQLSQLDPVRKLGQVRPLGPLRILADKIAEKRGEVCRECGKKYIKPDMMVPEDYGDSSLCHECNRKKD